MESILERWRLRYAGGDLDRASSLRVDSQWVQQRLASPDTRMVPVWKSQNLMSITVVGGHASAALMPLGSQLLSRLQGEEELVLLGLQGDGAVFAVDVSHLDEGELSDWFDGQFADLRLAGGSLPHTEAAMLAYARGVLRWHRTHAHCGRCGRRTRSEHGGHMRRCEVCELEIFPRIDSAVIMLVEAHPPDGDAVCLLGRHARLPPGIYSTLAGFVEPGESLEHAVAREVLEESGVSVSEVHYRASQPWPFPSSLMLGFRASAECTEIVIDREELEDARWFSRDQLRSFSEWTDERAQFRLPRHDSIARALIDEWLHG